MKLMEFHYVYETFEKNYLLIIWQKVGFYGYVYDFIVDYDAIAVDDILDIHKHLMQKSMT